MSLEKLGWNTYFQNNFEPYLDNKFLAARVITQHKGNYIVRSEEGDFNSKLTISVLNNINMNIFNKYLCCGKTLVFLGSSGVGKSTITNYLFDDKIQKTNAN